MSALAAPRMPKVVLAEAIAELRGRQHRLEAALDEVRSVIGGLEALGTGQSRRPTPPSETDGAPVVEVHLHNARGRAMGAGRDKLVLEVIAEHQPCARAALLERTGLSAETLKASIKRLRDEGKVRRLGERSAARYWTTEALDRHVAEHGQMPDGSPA